jgi:predicted HTH domain antitoxin
MQVQLELPDSVNVDPGYVKEALMAVLYSTGKLSVYQACQILDVSRRTFEEMLPRYGFSALVDSDENLDIELGV